MSPVSGLLLLLLALSAKGKVDKTEKPGTCPITKARCSENHPPHECTDDGDCLGDKKCCTPLCHRECTNVAPKTKPVKQCPTVNTFVKCPTPYPKPGCTTDGECGPDGMCCDVGCRIDCTKV